MSEVVFRVGRAESHDTKVSAWRVVSRGVEFYVTQAQTFIRDTGERVVHDPVVKQVGTGRVLKPCEPTHWHVTSLIRKDALQAAA